MGCNVFVAEPDNDVYEEVMKLFLEKSKPHLELGFSSRPIPNSLLKKRAQINFDYE
jgi:hypothetical protein